MSEIYFIRHGETDWNVSNVFRGRTNIELNAHGRTQAKLAAKALERRGIEQVFSSPLDRAMETSRIIAETCGVETQEATGLIDLDYGLWTGLSIPDVEKRFPQELQLWIADPLGFTFPQGESLKGVQQRTLETVRTLGAKWAKIAVVSHLAVLKALFVEILGMGREGFWKINVEPASISRFNFDHEKNRWVCQTLSESCHLEKRDAKA